jgi:hypothetical protein
MKFDGDSLVNINALLSADKETCGILELYDGSYFFLDDPSAVASNNSCQITNPEWTHSQLRFHTHLSKPYPSYEDILSVVRRPRTEVIVTKWGVWILNAFGIFRDMQGTPTTRKTYDYYSYLLYKNRGFDISLGAITAFCIRVSHQFNKEYDSSLSISFTSWEKATANNYELTY